jgi:hypothetical protein
VLGVQDDHGQAPARRALARAADGQLLAMPYIGPAVLDKLRTAVPYDGPHVPRAVPTAPNRVTAAHSGSLQAEIELLRQEVAQLRSALQEICDIAGEVCPEFEVCTHPWCNSSAAVKLIALEELKHG